MDDAAYAEYRRRRVRRLKKIILVTIALAVVIPVIVSIVFISLYVHSRRQLDDLQERYDELLSSMEQLRDDITYMDETRDVYSVSEVVDSKRDESSYVAYDADDTAGQESAEDVREVYLTFDDGPSIYTDEILDILAEYDVKATFFVIGKTDDVSVAAYKRIVDEGHTLGMHSYSHRYSQVYASKDAFIDEIGRAHV